MRGRSFDALRLTVSDAVAEGYPMSAVLSQLHSDVIYKQGLSDLEKALICAKVASVSVKIISEFLSRRPTQKSCIVYYFFFTFCLTNINIIR